MLPDEGVYAACTVEQPAPGCARVRLTGELDSSSAPVVQARILAGLPEGCQCVELDLSELVFIDSTGIRSLIQILKGSSAPEKRIVSPRASGPRRALEIIGVARLFPVVG